MPTRADKDYRPTVLQRRKVREICDVLRRGLYHRQDDNIYGDFITFRSPLNHTLSYGFNNDGTTVWAEMRMPDGSMVASTEDAGYGWVDHNLI